MTEPSAPELDFDLLRAELAACATEIARLRQDLQAVRANNRALLLHLEQRAEHVAALNAEIQRLEAEARGRQ